MLQRDSPKEHLTREPRVLFYCNWDRSLHTLICVTVKVVQLLFPCVRSLSVLSFGLGLALSVSLSLSLLPNVYLQTQTVATHRSQD